MTSRRKWQTTVYLDQRQVHELGRLSSLTKVPQAEMIRQAIDGFLASPPAFIQQRLDAWYAACPEGSEESGA